MVLMRHSEGGNGATAARDEVLDPKRGTRRRARAAGCTVQRGCNAEPSSPRAQPSSSARLVVGGRAG